MQLKSSEDKMSIEIIKKNKETMMQRTYFEAKIIFEGKTPSRIDIKKELCNKLEAKDDYVVIKKITTDYGSARAIAQGYIYDNKENMAKLVPKHTMLRHLTRTDRTAEKEKAKAAKLAAAPTVAKKKK